MPKPNIKQNVKSKSAKIGVVNYWITLLIIVLQVAFLSVYYSGLVTYASSGIFIYSANSVIAVILFINFALFIIKYNKNKKYADEMDPSHKIVKGFKTGILLQVRLILIFTFTFVLTMYFVLDSFDKGGSDIGGWISDHNKDITLFSVLSFSIWSGTAFSVFTNLKIRKPIIYIGIFFKFIALLFINVNIVFIALEEHSYYALTLLTLELLIMTFLSISKLIKTTNNGTAGHNEEEPEF